MSLRQTIAFTRKTDGIPPIDTARGHPDAEVVKDDRRYGSLIDTAIARPDTAVTDLNKLAVAGVRTAVTPPTRKAELSPEESRQARVMAWFRAQFPALAENAGDVATLSTMAEVAFALQSPEKQAEILGATAGWNTPPDSDAGRSQTQPVVKRDLPLIDSALPSTLAQSVAASVVAPVAKTDANRPLTPEELARVRGHLRKMAAGARPGETYVFKRASEGPRGCRIEYVS